MLDLSVVVPVLDEEKSLATLADEIDVALNRWHDLVYEILFVDDGSSDASWEVISKLAADDRARGIRLRRNFGKATALKVGVLASEGRTIVTLDADLQDDPAEIPSLLDKLDAGCDLVSGWKIGRKDPRSKLWSSKVFNAVTGAVTGVKLHDHNSGFKAARREVFERVPLYGELHRFVPATAHGLGYRVGEVAVQHRARAHGRSKYGVERYVRGFLDLLTVVMLTRYTRRPAHLFGGIGTALGLAGMAILLYLSGVWIFTDKPIGTRPLLTLGVLVEMVAIQLISLGILAELVLSRSDDRPLDTVVEKVGVLDP